MREALILSGIMAGIGCGAADAANLKRHLNHRI